VAAGSFRVERLLADGELRAMLEQDVRAGFEERPRRVRSRWIWDARGSALFEAITRLPEYYLTRREREILATRASEIAALADPETLIELGSGSSAKTTLLLDAVTSPGRLRRFVALDVSETALCSAGARLAERYPTLDVNLFVADFERHLDALTLADRSLVAFLGSTIGALEPDERGVFLSAVRRALGAGGSLLLGVDLVKEPARIEAAYNDPGGISAALIANVLQVLNRELEADFDPSRFCSEARWNPELERMEMAVRALDGHLVRIAALGLDVRFARDETLQTEISAKFRRDRFEAELAAAGLGLAAWWTDAAGDYAVCLARPG
jgi:L-histidine N-alpha-methyltransferase